MNIKQRPEDFIVEEIPKRQWKDEGPYHVTKALKRDMTTPEMIKRIAQASGLDPKDIRYAGLKDRRAITTQYLTSKRPLRPIADIQLTPVGFTDDHLHLGDLKANRFTIKASEVEQVRDVQIPNYFGDQRFSSNNVELGLAILKKDYKPVIDHLTARFPKLHKWENKGPVTVLQHAPQRLLLLLVHSVQSYLYNEVVSAYIKDNCEWMASADYAHGKLLFPEELEDRQVPLLGAVQDLGEWEPYYTPLLDEIGIGPSDMMNRSLPFLTMEGTTRSLKAPILHKRIELDDGVATVELELGTGAYATVCLSGWLS